jgi:hypothetical protein
MPQGVGESRTFAVPVTNGGLAQEEDFADFCKLVRQTARSGISSDGPDAASRPAEGDIHCERKERPSTMASFPASEI